MIDHKNIGDCFTPDDITAELLQYIFRPGGSTMPDRYSICIKKGLPWYVKPFRWVQGITLPHPWKPNQIDVWCRHLTAGDLQSRSLIVHEYVHVLQIMESGKGFAMFHPFLWTYLSGWMRYGYREHPFELRAYGFEATMRPVLETLDTEGVWRPEKLPSSCRMTQGGFRFGIWAPGILPAMVLNLILALIFCLVELLRLPLRGIQWLRPNKRSKT